MCTLKEDDFPIPRSFVRGVDVREVVREVVPHPVERHGVARHQTVLVQTPKPLKANTMQSCVVDVSNILDMPSHSHFKYLL